MKSPLIDTHAHLTWESFDGMVEEVVDRARDEGLIAIIDLGTSLKNSLHAREHAYRFDDVWFTAGIHPNNCENLDKSILREIEELARDPKCVAIGEIGLDYYWDKATPAVQEEWLRDQLALAKSLDKPVVLHDREASEDLLKILAEEGYDGNNSSGGVFHCFAGDRAMATHVQDLGFHTSCTGNLTYKKSDRPYVSEVVSLDRLLIETDSPFMAPVPKRGKQNEPAFVRHVAEYHAYIREVKLAEIAMATTKNAISLFNLPESLISEHKEDELFE